MLETTTFYIAPQGWFSNDYQVSKDGVTIATLETSGSGRTGRLSEVRGAVLRFETRGWMKPSFAVLQRDRLIVSASYPNFFSSKLRILNQEDSYGFEHRGLFDSGFVITNELQQIGSIEREGIFTRKTRAKIPSAFPLHLQMFFVWLALTKWQRDSAASD